MQENWIAVALMPVVLVLIVFVECSRLHCARRVQRRSGVTFRRVRTLRSEQPVR